MTFTSRLTPGQVLLGKLRITRLLGEGGMGAVYEVEHTLTRHRRALKVLHPRLSAEPTITNRLLREASVAGTLRTRHVVETFDAGQLESGAAFVLMELLEGHPVSSELGRGPTSVDRLSWVVAQVCDALIAAHAAGIVHRDLKPDNIFVARDLDGSELVKVLDFGISKFADSALPGSHITHAHTLMGTPQYMSPEQTKSATNVDGRSDTYSLGVMMYEALAGSPPFDADSLPEILVKINLGTHRSLREAAPGVDPDFVAIVEKAMSMAPAERFQSAGALKAALEAGSVAAADLRALHHTPSATPGAPVPPTAGPERAGVSPTLAAAAAAPTPLLGALSGVAPTLAIAEAAKTPLLGAPSGVAPTLAITEAAKTEGGASARGVATLLASAGAATTPIGAAATPGGVASTWPASGAAPTVAADGQRVAHPVTPPSPTGAGPGEAARAGLPRGAVAGLVVAALAVCGALGAAAFTIATAEPDEELATESHAPPPSVADAGVDAGGPCDGLTAQACAERGRALELGDEEARLTRDEAQAAAHYGPACEAGVAAACTGMGRLYFHGRGLPQDDVRSREFAELGCEGGDAVGCANLAAFYKEGRGGVEQDQERTLALVLRACEAGRAASCFSSGFLYERGRGTPVDLSRARALYRQACDGGSELGCTQLGFLMSEGRGGPRDFARARDFYRRGCVAEHTLACVNLGSMLLNGLGGSRDREEAATLFERACAQLGGGGPRISTEGSEVGCGHLGIMYEAGAGVPRDPARARALFERACEGGRGESCEKLARMLRAGRGGPADPDRAREVLRRSCEAGHANACRNAARR